MTPHLTGLVESSLYVADLARSVAFYGRILGFRLIYSEGDRLRALSVADRQILLLFRINASKEPTETPNGRIPPHDGHGALHLAFAVPSNQEQAWREQLMKEGVAIESEVHCGGHSIYFRDPDGHLVELITPGCWPIY